MVKSAINRRAFLLGGGASAGVFVAGLALWKQTGPARASGSEVFEITRSEEEWRAILTPDQYSILREEDTERAFTSVLNNEKREGLYHCAGCDLPLYSSEAKFDSGTGWPSFYEALPDAIGTREDRKFFMLRTECHCRRCGGHLGHIFDDGPEPTGKRHCINGLALVFKPANAG